MLHHKLIVIPMVLAILSYVVVFLFFFLFSGLLLVLYGLIIPGSHCLYCTLFQCKHVCTTVREELNDDDDDDDGYYSAGCPTDFTSISSVNGCYNVVTNPMDWSTAGQQCRSLGAHLLVINDAEEQSAIAEMLTSMDRQCSFSAFLYCLFIVARSSCDVNVTSSPVNVTMRFVIILINEYDDDDDGHILVKFGTWMA